MTSIRKLESSLALTGLCWASPAGAEDRPAVAETEIGTTVGLDIVSELMDAILALVEDEAPDAAPANDEADKKG